MSKIRIRELPDMMSAKFSDYLTPLFAFGSDLHYKIHATSLTTSTFPGPLSSSNADIISGSSRMAHPRCSEPDQSMRVSEVLIRPSTNLQGKFSLGRLEPRQQKKVVCHYIPCFVTICVRIQLQVGDIQCPIDAAPNLRMHVAAGGFPGKGMEGGTP